MLKKVKKLNVEIKETAAGLVANQDGDLGDLVWKFIIAGIAIAAGIAIYAIAPDMISNLFTDLIDQVKESFNIT